MKTLYRILFYLLISSTLWSQTAEEAIELVENENGFGIKAAGMGNAFTGLADDYSAIYWNPAGLAQLQNGELSASLSHSNYEYGTSYLNTNSLDSRSFTKLQSLGLVYPFPVVRGSFVLALGYQKINNPDAFAEFSGENSIYDDELDIDFPYKESYTIANEGEVDNFSVAAAIDLSKNFSAGITMNFIGGSKNYSYNYLDENLVENGITIGDTTYYQDYSYFDTVSTINNDFSGFNIKLGGLFKLSENLKLGTTITFPTTITIDEKWSTEFYDEYYDDLIEGSGEWDYLLRIPFKFSAGLSFSNKLLTLSTAINYTDWSQLKYEAPSNRDAADYTYLALLNTAIRENYRSVLDYSIGGEVDVLNSGLKVRGGYQYKPNPLNNLGSEFDKKLYSFGFGYTVDKRTTLEFSYTFADWKQNKEYEGLWDYVELEENIKTEKLLFGLKYNF